MATTRTPTLGPAARPVAVPADLDDGLRPRAHGRVQLPLHIRWSGPPVTYDLDDRADRARVYEQVLREGTEDDVRFYVNRDHLAAGFIVRHVQDSPGFARLIVESEDDSTELDLGADARLFPAEAPTLPTLSGEELAVDKVLAVFGRAEARDLAAVEPRYGLDRLFELAAEKDHGFTPEMFAETAGRFSRLRPDEFGLDPEQYEQLERKVLEWQEQARNG